MRVIRADVLGMCFGVRDALTTIERIDDPGGVLIHGQLVHNEIVLHDLKARGFAMRNEADRADGPEHEGGRVVITAHGVSDRERQRLMAKGASFIDTTCPLVRRVHQAAQSLQARGFHVLVIGRKEHVEVLGIVEDLDSVDVIESEADVRHFARPRLGIVCQTTATERSVVALQEAIEAQNPEAEIELINTVCQPTRDHQRALERLLEQVDAVVVVGGRQSNNTRQLVDRCRERGRPVVQVQSACDLDPAWFTRFAVVGLTAGTSTLDRTIDEVHRALVWIGSHFSSIHSAHSEHEEAMVLGAGLEETVS